MRTIKGKNNLPTYCSQCFVSSLVDTRPMNFLTQAHSSICFAYLFFPVMTRVLDLINIHHDGMVTTSSLKRRSFTNRHIGVTAMFSIYLVSNDVELPKQIIHKQQLHINIVYIRAVFIFPSHVV